MKKDTIYLTHDGHKKLLDELKYLKTKKRMGISKDIEKARGHGDLSENAEYDAAKDAQAFNEKKISELEGKLSNAQIIDEASMSSDAAYVGSTVTLEDVSSKEKMKYMLVSEAEADFSQNKISITSPFGKGLLGHKEKDIVEIKVPAGILKYKLVKIER